MIRRRKTPKNNTEENYWLSATDLMTGIVLLVLLLLVMVILFLNQTQGEDFTAYDETIATENYDAYITPTQPYDDYNDYYDEDHQNDNGGGEGGENHPTEAPQIIPTEPDENNTDKGEKAAVFVTVVDADTGNAIKEEGISFELYEGDKSATGLKKLYTYYPNKVEYEEYETGTDGTFYLPEKIDLGNYSLHNLDAPEGYYTAEKAEFTIESPMDWSKPFSVTIPLVPIKSNISIHAVDDQTGTPLADVTFEINAAKDILAVDGSVRFKEGDFITELVTNKDGYAESDEMYYGSYNIVNSGAPEYYGVSTEVIKVEIDSSTQGEAPENKFKLAKTSCTLRLIDENTEEPISGAVLSPDGRDDLVTDSSGSVKMTDMKKNSTYSVKLKSIPEPYFAKTDEIVFAVDAKGYIDNAVEAEITVTAYTTHVTFTIKDLLFGRAVGGIPVELVDESGDVLYSWHSGTEEMEIRDIKPGDYYLVLNGDTSSREKITIDDTGEKQTFTSTRWATIDVFAILIVVALVALAAIVASVLIRRRRRRGKDDN